MPNLIKNQQNGMNIFGQGSHIVRTTLPFLIIAIVCHVFLSDFSSLPASLSIVKPAGYLFLSIGILLWVAGLVQLLIFFPKGKLVTNGSYTICRNPVYASYIIFILPGVSFLTLTWVYLAVAVVMFSALKYFIKKEEQDLLKIFGNDYSVYMKKVPQVFPFFRQF